jgi:hypothetical protein
MVPDDAIFTFDQIAALLGVKPPAIRKLTNLPETDPRHLSAFGSSQKLQRVIGRELNKWEARTTDLQQQRRRAGPISYASGNSAPHGRRRGRPVR